MIICILNIHKFEIHKGLLNIYIHLVLMNIIQGHNECWDGTSLKLMQLLLTFTDSPPTNAGAAMFSSGVLGEKGSHSPNHSSEIKTGESV